MTAAAPRRFRPHRPPSPGRPLLALAGLALACAACGSPPPEETVDRAPAPTQTPFVVTATPPPTDAALPTAAAPSPTSSLPEGDQGLGRAPVPATQTAAPTDTPAPTPPPPSNLPERIQGLARAPGVGLDLPGDDALLLPYAFDGQVQLEVGGAEGSGGQRFTLGDNLRLDASGYQPGEAVELGLYALRGELSEAALASAEGLSLARLGSRTVYAGDDGILSAPITLPRGVQPGVFAVLACGRGRCAPAPGAPGAPDAGAWFVLSAPDGTQPWEGRPARVRVDRPGDTLNVREAPGVGARILDRLKPGAEVAILDGPALVDGRSPWYLVRARDGALRGWVNGVYLVAGD